jgi:hypothetical protein
MFSTLAYNIYLSKENKTAMFSFSVTEMRPTMHALDKSNGKLFFFNCDTFVLFTWLIWSVGFKTGIVLILFLSRVILTESDSLDISANRYTSILCTLVILVCISFIIPNDVSK